MAEDRKFKGSLGVWLTHSWTTPEDILKRYRQGDEMALQSLTFSNGDLSSIEGWSKVGTAEITGEFFSDDVILEGMAGGLRQEIQKVRAEAQAKVTRLEERLSQLLSLPNLSANQGTYVNVQPTDQERLDDDIPF